MRELIRELKEEHIQIANTLEEVKKDGILSERGRANLLLVKNMLLNHLKKEDEKLYPLLKKHSNDNQNLSGLMDSFIRNLKSVSTIAMNFYTKFEQNEKSASLQREFESMCIALEKRIRKEENILYNLVIRQGVH